MDRSSAAAANRLLGNRIDAPVLEVLMQGAKLRVLEDTWIAVAGADLGCAIAPWTARKVVAGTVAAFSDESRRLVGLRRGAGRI